MKIKPVEFLLLLFAVIFGVGAIAAQQIEPKAESHADIETTEEPNEPPAEFFVDTETVDHESLEVTEPEQANQTVQQFFTLFTQLNTDPNNTQAMMQVKSLLSKKAQTTISTEQTQAIRDLARTVGILSAPRNVAILRTEQTTPGKIDVIVEVTTENNQTTEKRVSTIHEDSIQKIDSFTIIE